MEKKEVIFLLPYLHVNTTSAERFKSLINAFDQKRNVSVKVFLIDYRLTKSYFKGLENSLFENDKEIQFVRLSLHPNIIQKIGFFFLNHDFKLLWRVSQLLHLILYKSDIFHPFGLDVKVASEANNGFVIASGSHFSYFTIANDIARRLNYKLVLDYRDPWTFGYPSVDGFKFIHHLKVRFNRAQELYLLSQSFLNTTVSKSLIEQFPSIFREKFELVPNGSNFNVNEVRLITNFHTFNIVYAGTIYNNQLNNHVFFDAFSEFIKNKDLNSIKLQFIGSSANKNLTRLIESYQLMHCTDITNRVTKLELLEYLNNASVFLHLKYGTNKDIISSKQAEYLMFKRPILLPVSDHGDLKESILSNHAGYVCNHKQEVIECLELLWEKFLKKENLFINQPTELINHLSREKIAQNFAEKIIQ